MVLGGHDMVAMVVMAMVNDGLMMAMVVVASRSPHFPFIC